jgi:hypothetical protein
LVALSLVAVTTLVGVGAEQQSALAGTSSQNYSVGFSDGCNGVPVSGHHTSDYLAGHTAGEAKCQGGVGGGNSASSSSSSATGGSSDVRITIEK